MLYRCKRRQNLHEDLEENVKKAFTKFKHIKKNDLKNQSPVWCIELLFLWLKTLTWSSQSTRRTSCGRISIRPASSTPAHIRSWADDTDCTSDGVIEAIFLFDAYIGATSFVKLANVKIGSICFISRVPMTFVVCIFICEKRKNTRHFSIKHSRKLIKIRNSYFERSIFLLKLFEYIFHNFINMEKSIESLCCWHQMCK